MNVPNRLDSVHDRLSAIFWKMIPILTISNQSLTTKVCALHYMIIIIIILTDRTLCTLSAGYCVTIVTTRTHNRS